MVKLTLSSILYLEKAFYHKKLQKKSEEIIKMILGQYGTSVIPKKSIMSKQIFPTVCKFKSIIKLKRKLIFLASKNVRELWSLD